MRCEGKTQWLRVVSSATHTHHSNSAKRGTEGIAAGQILSKYQGILVHDFWAPYDTLDCQHSRCNAHLLRELTACVESGHLWAQSIIRKQGLNLMDCIKSIFTDNSVSSTT